MHSFLPFQIQLFYNKYTVLNTNLLVLYAMGLFDMNQTEKNNRTKAFTKHDFLMLYYEVKKFGGIVTTFNILTETTNLTANGNEVFKQDFFSKFEITIDLMDKHYFKSKELSKNKEFKKFGLAYSLIAHLASQGYLVITDDFRLSTYLTGINLPVINFNYVRFYSMLK
jgi:hypothetical protein